MFPRSINKSKVRIYHPQKNIKEQKSGINAKDLPDDIADASESIVNKTLICKETGKPFKIVKLEFDLYKKMKVPLPTVHPDVRMRRKFLITKPLTLEWSSCSNCRKKIYIRGPLERQRAKVLCEDCYLKIVK